MRNLWIAAFALALVGNAAMTQDEPSLGDVARQHRHEHDKNKTKPKKVVDNDEIPSQPPSSQESTPSEEPASRNTSTEASARSAEHWKNAIQAQKDAIASMQKQLDEFKNSIHFVEANRYSNGVQYNQEQLRREKEAERVEKQLEEQKKKLSDMQEAARQEGFGNAVYDP